ncbi:MAG TPA: hypothetical protein VGK67_27635 [Myxococcales bacterium]|jgi:hypothetical protein
MLKNPVVLVAVAVLVAGAVWLLASRSQPETDLKPLTPAAGESLRRQGVSPKPQKADAVEALRKLQTGPALPPGDAALRDLLQTALGAKEEPTYRANIDVPFNDPAAQQVSDEVRVWIERKMAGLGFGVASGKPTVVWRVQIDPGEAGRYSIKLKLRAGAESKLDAAYDLPAAYSATRLDATFAPGLSAPLIAPSTAAPPAPGSPAQ